MKKLAAALGAVLALSMLGACATGFYDGDHHQGDAYYSDAYYDDFYGPYNDGYWASDGAFYYRDAADHPYVRDDAKHFRHENAGTGFHHIQAHKAPPGDRRGGEPKTDH